MVKTADALRRARDPVPDLGIHVTSPDSKRPFWAVAHDVRDLFAALQPLLPSTPVLVSTLRPCTELNH